MSDKSLEELRQDYIAAEDAYVNARAVHDATSGPGPQLVAARAACAADVSYTAAYDAYHKKLKEIKDEQETN